MTTFLTQEELMKNAPSIFTTGSHSITGSTYEHISTYSVLKGLFDIGFGVTHAIEARMRDKERKVFGRHLIRLRRENEPEVNGNYSELVLINAHDGTSSYQLRAGVYRMICSNGMIVGNEYFSRKVRHQGDVKQRVLEACENVIEVFPTIIDKTEAWSKLMLTQNQKLAFSEAAKNLKWDKDGETIVEASDLLRPRRLADEKDDLWTTFNIMQEKFIRGGVTLQNKETKHRRKSKPVKNPYENNRLNTALWQLTEHMATLVK